MLVEHGLEKCCCFLAALAAADMDNRFARMVVDGADAILLLGLRRRGDHHLLAFGAPHGA